MCFHFAERNVTRQLHESVPHMGDAAETASDQIAYVGRRACREAAAGEPRIIEWGGTIMNEALGALFVLVLSGATKGLLGVGLPIVAVPLLILFLPLQTAIALMTVPLVATNVSQALVGKERPLVVARDVAAILATMVVGVAFGVHLLSVIEPDRAKQILGLMMIFVAATMIRSPKLAMPVSARPFADPIAGFCCGILGGLVGQAGTPMFIYLLLRGTDKDRFVQTASMFVAISQIAIALFLGRSGLVPLETFLLSCLACIPVYLGMQFGGSTRDTLSELLFRRMLLGVIVLSGVNCLLA